MFTLFFLLVGGACLLACMHSSFILTVNCQSVQLKRYTLGQACQTLTILRATKATKTSYGAAKVPKNTSAGHIEQYSKVKNDFLLLSKIFSTQNYAFYNIKLTI